MKMASKETKGSGTCILTFLTLFNFTTLLGIVIYHFCYLDTDAPTRLMTNTKDLMNNMIDELKSELKTKTKSKRSVSQNEHFSDVFADFIQDQNSQLLDACRSTCKQEVVSVLKEAVEHLRPATTSEYKRQIDTTGNELASIFGEIAKSEIDILNRYCTNGSAICLPGEKGAPGIKGDSGYNGTDGQRGIKGDPGVKGDTGFNGTQGLTGAKGEPGSKGDPGTAGTQGLAGPPGPKGDKGDSGVIMRTAAPTPFSPTQTPDGCCTKLSAPEFQTQLVEIRVPEGTDISLPCQPTGYPAPKAQWKWSPSSSLDRLRSHMSPDELSISNSRVNDSRLYTCFVQNALGRAEKQYSVQVYPHITFEQLPQNSTVLTGSQVTFECKVDGPLNPSVTWYKVMKSGTRLPLTQDVTPITHGSRLVVNNASPASAGEYVCVGDNGVEKIETSSYLHLYGPPNIIPPGTVTVVKGQTVVLTCDAVAYPPAKITWSYPPGVTNAYINSNGSLVILDAQPKDSTTFFCTATNTYGQDKDSVKLDVKVPAEVSVTPVIIPLGAGTTNIAIQCNPGGDPPLSVSFRKDGIPVTSNGHILSLPGNVLLVNSATQKDVGEYTCSVSNSIGTSQASAYAFKDTLGTVSCSDKFSQCTDNVCGAMCPPACNLDTTNVNGFMQYSMDSSICRAGIQSGAINTNGGQIIWVNKSNMTSHAGGTQNGISSQSLSVNPGDLTAIPILMKP